MPRKTYLGDVPPPLISKRQRVQSLRSVPLFSALNVKELQLIVDLSVPRQVASGTTVIKEGASGNDFFVIESGKVLVSKNGRKVATLEAGDHFGELALLSRSARRATVTTQTDSSFLVLSRWAFMGLLGQIPDMAIKLLKGAAERLRETQSVPID